MPDYNLAGLSPRSFEQLIQALAAKVIGPGIVVFGDGPDGGREATFDGAIDYPNKVDRWQGYGVIQAKFKQRLQDTKTDGDWAIQQLRAELREFAKPDSKRRKPEYYIFVTNIAVSSVKDTGAKDKLFSVAQEFNASVPLKGFDVWDYDKIRTYLDANEDIRHGYAAWITSGDVLSAVMEWVKPQQPDFIGTITTFLSNELLANQYVDLERAGHNRDDAIPMARVFVDLPTHPEQLLSPPVEFMGPNGELAAGFSGIVVQAGAERLAPESQNPQAPTSVPVEPGRYVLMGGPGQGKTTIGRFICQLFRASILKDRTQHLLSREVRDVLEIINDQCRIEHIELPTGRRFPIWIDLKAFAKALAATEMGHINSLLSYIVDQVKRKTDREVGSDDFRAWLRAYPWIIVLDGLDEVPASSNRGAVLEAVQNFWNEATSCNADLLVVATSRPQGYNQDFKYYQHHYLVPLSIPRAMHYARRLVEIRYGQDQDRKVKILTRLKDASENNATSRLMHSPLQVTIMTALVDKVGKPPQERWNLFKGYYGVIYDREVERDIPAAIILRDHQTDVNAIHNRVGLLLQVECERPGETDARLSKSQFATVVETRLVEQGFEGAALYKLKQDIIEAAMDRLVFLVELQEDEVGFEIRSLQEFMAADALTEGNDEIVITRLRKIAPVSNWRNVFLFAAGKCFIEREYLRDSIQAICSELNEEDEITHATLAGSQLALDLLEDGLALRIPKYAKVLCRSSLSLMNLPPANYHTRLAGLYQAEHEHIYREEIERALSYSCPQQRLGAWACLIALINADVQWAVIMGDKYWPDSRDEQFDILQVAGSKSGEAWILPKLLNALPHFSPTQLYNCRHEFSNVLLPDYTSLPEWFDVMHYVIMEVSPYPRQIKVPLRITEGNDNYSFKYVSVGDKSQRLIGWKDIPNACSAWIPFIRAGQFIENPSKSILSQSLETIAANCDMDAVRHCIDRVPWPIAACLAACECKDDILKIANQVEAGDLGDIDKWEKAEARWKVSGVVDADIYYMDDTRWPFDSHIDDIGFPPEGGYTSFSVNSEARPLLTELINVYALLNQSKIRSYIAHSILFLVGHQVDSELSVEEEMPDSDGIKEATSELFTYIDEEQLCVMIKDALLLRRFVCLDALNVLNNQQHLSEPLIETLDLLHTHWVYVPQSKNEYLTTLLSQAYCANSARKGILRVISLFVFAGATASIPNHLLNLSLCDDDSHRRAVLLIRLSLGNWSHLELREIAQATIDFNSKDLDMVDRIVEDAINIFKAHEVPQEQQDHYWLELHRQMPSTQWKSLRIVQKMLNDCLRRRPSQLADTQVWSELKLPGDLSSLLA